VGTIAVEPTGLSPSVEAGGVTPGIGISTPDTSGVVSAVTAGAGGGSGGGVSGGRVVGAYMTPADTWPRPVGTEAPFWGVAGVAVASMRLQYQALPKSSRMGFYVEDDAGEEASETR
jgi:hypothetical protein